MYKVDCLKIRQILIELLTNIYLLISELPSNKKFGLTSQIKIQENYKYQYENLNTQY